MKIDQIYNYSRYKIVVLISIRGRKNYRRRNNDSLETTYFDASQSEFTSYAAIHIIRVRSRNTTTREGSSTLPPSANTEARYFSQTCLSRSSSSLCQLKGPFERRMYFAILEKERERERESSFVRSRKGIVWQGWPSFRATSERWSEFTSLTGEIRTRDT